MSELANRSRHQGAALVVVVVAACLVILAPPRADGGSLDGAPRRWAGYVIPANGDAAGGWIGGYRDGDTTLFLTTPTKSPNRAGLRSPDELGNLPGRSASRKETARAAWILSKYGAYKDATQAAAVDATVYHLLVGGAWEIVGPLGAGRIRQSGDRASVSRFARIMLRQSRAHAGRYTAELAVSAADVGGSVAVTLSVTDGHGRPASGLPVTLAMSGHPSAPAVTGDDGRAVARFAADARGWQDVIGTVSQVPEHRLHTWAAEKRRQASAAEGGVRRTLVVTGKAAVRGPQTLTLKVPPEPLVAGADAQVTATVTGGGDAAARRPPSMARSSPCPQPSAQASRSPPRRRGSPATATTPWPPGWRPEATSPGASWWTVRTPAWPQRRAARQSGCGLPPAAQSRSMCRLCHQVRSVPRVR